MITSDLFPLLAIDTSSSAGFVVLFINEGDFFSKKIELSDSHNENVAVVVSELFENAGIVPNQISSIFLGGGPGSFTGLRIGASFVSGLYSGIQSTSNHAVILYVHQSLEVFARGVLKTDTDRTIVSIIADARRDEVYGFSLNNNGSVVVPLGIYPTSYPFEGAVSPESLEIEVFLHGVLDSFSSNFSEFKQYTKESVSLLEMHYLREVAARTIEERNQIKTLTKGSHSSLK